MYSAQQIKLVYQWCASHKIHFVADEVYALSPVSEIASPFVSALDFMDDIGDKQYFHWLYGLSKDFCLSGLRLGVLYTENEKVRKGLLQYHMQYAVPWHTQQLVYHFLSDKQWVTGFLKESQKRLIGMYNACKDELQKYAIDYFEAEHGLFVWINLSKWLLKVCNINADAVKTYVIMQTLWKNEMAFLDYLRIEKNVFLAPGECFGATEPGFYRICFGAVKDEQALKDAIKRVHEGMQLFRAKKVTPKDNGK